MYHARAHGRAAPTHPSVASVTVYDDSSTGYGGGYGYGPYGCSGSPSTAACNRLRSKVQAPGISCGACQKGKMTCTRSGDCEPEAEPESEDDDDGGWDDDDDGWGDDDSLGSCYEGDGYYFRVECEDDKSVAHSCCHRAQGPGLAMARWAKTGARSPPPHIMRPAPCR